MSFLQPSSLRPISDITSKPSTTEDRWNQIQGLVSLANDLAKYSPSYRSNPMTGIGPRFTGLQTSLIRETLIHSDEVQSALDAADAAQPLMFRLSHPNKLSLITPNSEDEIPLSDGAKVLAGELLNRLYMPRGSDPMQVRAAWAFRSVFLPIPFRTPSS